MSNVSTNFSRQTKSGPFFWAVWALLFFPGLTFPLQAVIPAGTHQELFLSGYLLMRCSSINLIRGLNLTPVQLGELERMAAVVDACCPPPPLTATGSKDWKPLIEDSIRLEKALSEGKQVPDAFRQRLSENRQKQSSLISKGLRFNRKAWPLSCGRCHHESGSTWGTWPWFQVIAKHPGIQKEQGISHFIGPYGIIGIGLVAWFSSSIDRLLTDTQKAAATGFSCCLLPPKEMSDPTRIGEAQFGTWEGPLLEKIRGANRLSLPVYRYYLREAVDRFLESKHPGAVREDHQRGYQILEDIITRTRSLSDVDFQLQLPELARKLHETAQIPKTPRGKTPPDRLKSFNNSFFLLIPGSRNTYRRLLQEITPASAPSDPVLMPAFQPPEQ